LLLLAQNRSISVIWKIASSQRIFWRGHVRWWSLCRQHRRRITKNLPRRSDITIAEIPLTS